jgi:metal-responsive CopG/Arc/MetJ family transcriptional regulator
MKDLGNRDGVAILVAAKAKSGKAVRVNITLPEDVLAEIDRYAEDHGFTRSGFLTQAAKRALQESDKRTQKR